MKVDIYPLVNTEVLYFSRPYKSFTTTNIDLAEATVKPMEFRWGKIKNPLRNQIT